MRFLKRLFCKHEYEKEFIEGGFLVVDGWLVKLWHFRCKKCGKIMQRH